MATATANPDLILVVDKEYPGNWFTRTTRTVTREVGGFFRWLGRGIKRAFNKTVSMVKRAFNWTKGKARTAWRWSGKEIAQGWAWSKGAASRSGKWVGRNARTAAKWSWTMGRRGAGYLLRTGSNVILLGLAGLVFLFAIDAWVGDNVADAHDYWEAKVHPKTVAMSRGKITTLNERLNYLDHDIDEARGEEIWQEGLKASQDAMNQWYETLREIDPLSTEELDAIRAPLDRPIDFNAMSDEEATDLYIDQHNTQMPAEGDENKVRRAAYWLGRHDTVVGNDRRKPRVDILEKDNAVNQMLDVLKERQAEGVRIPSQAYLQGVEDEWERIQVVHKADIDNYKAMRTKQGRRTAAKKTAASK